MARGIVGPWVHGIGGMLDRTDDIALVFSGEAKVIKKMIPYK